MKGKRDLKAAAKILVARERRNQGLPPKIRKPRVISRIAALVGIKLRLTLTSNKVYMSNDDRHSNSQMIRVAAR